MNGDVENVTLFFDFDCDGILETSVTDSCVYNRPAGCSVDLTFTVPAVTNITTYNGRGHVVFNTPTTDPCTNITFGDIEDFVITVYPEPVINTQSISQTVFVGDNVSLSVTTTSADTFQWQVSTNGGGVFTDISDGTEYSGTNTSNLTINSIDIDKNNYQYRVLVSNSTSTPCPQITSSPAIISVRYRTVITNRRVTYRVNKN